MVIWKYLKSVVRYAHNNYCSVIRIWKLNSFIFAQDTHTEKYRSQKTHTNNKKLYTMILYISMKIITAMMITTRQTTTSNYCFLCNQQLYFLTYFSILLFFFLLVFYFSTNSFHQYQKKLNGTKSNKIYQSNELHRFYKRIFNPICLSINKNSLKSILKMSLRTVLVVSIRRRVVWVLDFNVENAKAPPSALQQHSYCFRALMRMKQSKPWIKILPSNTGLH